MGVLKTILWILLGYFILKVIGRLLRPFLLAYARKKTGEFFQQAAANNPNSHSGVAREGETIIDRKPRKRKDTGTTVGEYIEYEEIE